MTEIITALRNMAGGTGSTGADLVTLGQNHVREILAHIDAQAAEIERLKATAARADTQAAALRTVERWANHHARKPNTTAEEALGVIQHHPAIRAITASYADGVVPDTPDPYAEIERLRVALSEIHGQFIPGSRKLYTTPDAVLDSIRATAANALKDTK